MAFDGSTSCWWPKLPVKVKRTQRLDIAKYGDGYEQRMLSGINTMMTEWDLTFDTKPELVIREMDAYLAARKGASFGFVDPIIGTVVPVFCDEWDIEWHFRRYPANGPRETFGTLTATFVRAYGVGLVAA